jgi:hypothetical protein
MTFAEKLREQSTVTQTENGAKTFSTTLNGVLDFFAMGGASRSRTDKEVINMFVKAFSEDQQLALRALFYFRDIRKGQGERRLFRVISKYLAENHGELMLPVLQHIPEYGRYDDYYVFVDTPLEDHAFTFLLSYTLGLNGFKQDPLVFKWLKSTNTSSKESCRLGRLTAEKFGLTVQEYRKFLSAGRAKVAGLVEIPMSKREWAKINYEQVPSKAMLKYRKAYSKRDGERFVKYLASVKKGEAKINVGTLYPSDLVSASFNGDKAVDAMWAALPDYTKSTGNAIVMADTSGSMGECYNKQNPINVSVALAIYFAERNKGAFKNYFLTFDTVPSMQKVTGITLSEKVQSVLGDRPCGNTNLQAGFDLILRTALDNKVSQEEMPSTIYVISDMEFDAVDNAYGIDIFGRARRQERTNFEAVEEKYVKAGYKMPNLVFWNVASRQDNVPVRYKQKGVTLVSGYSATTFLQVVANVTPVDHMLTVLNGPRYEVIKVSQ